jgi:inosine-uridine nucleoside N-ribohydrolase
MDNTEKQPLKNEDVSEEKPKKFQLTCDLLSQIFVVAICIIVSGAVIITIVLFNTFQIHFQRVIIVSDMGNGDIAAISALLSPPNKQRIKILGMITTQGILSLDDAFTTALKLMTKFGINRFPIIKGSSAPNTSAFDKVLIEESNLLTSKLGLPADVDNAIQLPTVSPAEFMTKQAEKFPDKVLILALGPLSDIAEAVESEAFRSNIQGIISWGGYVYSDSSNNTAAANLRADPEAADKVIKSGVPIWFIGADVDDMEEINDIILESYKKQSPFEQGKLVQENMKNVAKFSSRKYFDEFLATGYLLQKELFEFENKTVKVNLGDDENRGKLELSPNDGNNVTIANDINHAKLIHALSQTLYE